MGHKNYSKFSGHFNKNNEEEKQEVTETVNLVVNEETEIEFPIVEGLQENDVVTEEGIIKAEERFVTGVVVGCEKLYVREKPGKEFNHVTIISKGTEVQVDKIESTTEDFYKVVTSMGFEGYCMKKFISIK